jgi:hypothetical protein
MLNDYEKKQHQPEWQKELAELIFSNQKHVSIYEIYKEQFDSTILYLSTLSISKIIQIQVDVLSLSLQDKKDLRPTASTEIEDIINGDIFDILGEIDNIKIGEAEDRIGRHKHYLYQLCKAYSILKKNKAVNFEELKRLYFL